MPHESAQSLSERMRITYRRADETYSERNARYALEAEAVDGKEWEAVPSGQSAFLLLRSPLFKQAVGHLISNNQPYSISDSAQYDQYLADLV